MVAAPLILGGGDLKISDQNNWAGPEQKSKFGGTLIFNRGLEIFKKGVLDKKRVTKK